MASTCRRGVRRSSDIGQREGSALRSSKGKRRTGTEVRRVREGCSEDDSRGQVRLGSVSGVVGVE